MEWRLKPKELIEDEGLIYLYLTLSQINMGPIGSISIWDGVNQLAPTSTITPSFKKARWRMAFRWLEETEIMMKESRMMRSEVSSNNNNHTRGETLVVDCGVCHNMCNYNISWYVLSLSLFPPPPFFPKFYLKLRSFQFDG